jgi:hypothetical protein
MSPTEQEARALVEAWYEGKNTFIPQFRLDDLIARLIPLVERAHMLTASDEPNWRARAKRAEAERDRLYEELSEDLGITDENQPGEPVLRGHPQLREMIRHAVIFWRKWEGLAEQLEVENTRNAAGWEMANERAAKAEANVARLRDALTNLQWMLQTPSSVSLIP